jgi:hypothetical protein
VKVLYLHSVGPGELLAGVVVCLALYGRSAVVDSKVVIDFEVSDCVSLVLSRVVRTSVVKASAPGNLSSVLEITPVVVVGTSAPSGSGEVGFGVGLSGSGEVGFGVGLFGSGEVGFGVGLFGSGEVGFGVGLFGSGIVGFGVGLFGSMDEGLGVGLSEAAGDVFKDGFSPSIIWSLEAEGLSDGLPHSIS